MVCDPPVEKHWDKFTVVFYVCAVGDPIQVGVPFGDPNDYCPSITVWILYNYNAFHQFGKLNLLMDFQLPQNLTFNSKPVKNYYKIIVLLHLSKSFKDLV